VDLGRRGGDLRRDILRDPHGTARAAVPNQPRNRVPVVKSELEKVGRNQPCPCGSGRKYKMCHGRPGAG